MTTETLPHPTLLEVARIRQVVSAAFDDDPMFAWLLPDPLPGADGRAAWLGVLIEAYAAGGTVDVVRDDEGSIAGAALWKLDDRSLPYSEAPTIGGLLMALVGPQAAITRGGALRVFSERKPEPPYHYLQFLAVHPDHQGRGFGRHLVAAGQQRAAAAGVPVYLESTNPANLGFYRAMGLTQVGTFDLQPDGPPAFCLRWDP
jgi:ribosomal protein S18 acetylase RimI-like enzyme